MNKKKDSKELSAAGRLLTNIILTVLLVSFLLPIGLSLRKDIFPGSMPVGGYIFLGVLSIISILLLTAFNWRCPDCRRLLSLQDMPARCPRCGAQLDNIQSKILRFISDIFESKPAKDIPSYAPITRIIYDIGKHRLNDIGFHDPMKALNIFGPADETDFNEDEGLLVYDKIGVAAEVGEDGVYSFEVVLDDAWEEISSKECSAFYLRTDSGKEVHVDFRTNESELAELLGETTDRTSLSNGDLQCLYDVSGAFVTATFKNNGRSLRHLEFVESEGPSDTQYPDEQESGQTS